MDDLHTSFVRLVQRTEGWHWLAFITCVLAICLIGPSAFHRTKDHKYANTAVAAFAACLERSDNSEQAVCQCHEYFAIECRQNATRRTVTKPAWVDWHTTVAGLAATISLIISNNSPITTVNKMIATGFILWVVVGIAGILSFLFNTHLLDTFMFTWIFCSSLLIQAASFVYLAPTSVEMANAVSIAATVLFCFIVRYLS